MAEFIRLHPDLSDKGWGGSTWSNTSFNHFDLASKHLTLLSPLIERAKSIVKDFFWDVETGESVCRLRNQSAVSLS